MRLHWVCNAPRSQCLRRAITELSLKSKVAVSHGSGSGGGGMLGDKLIVIVIPCRHWLRLTPRTLVHCSGLMRVRGGHDKRELVSLFE